MRIITGLPINTWNEALLAEADLDSVSDLAKKNTLSLYARINPQSRDEETLIKQHFNSKRPIWAKTLDEIPENIWKGEFQTTLKNKKTINKKELTFHPNTLKNQEEAEVEENKYNVILYTDASVQLNSNPPGKATTGYIWYERAKAGKENEEHWKPIRKGTADVGPGHSSYSAESLALQQALQNFPTISPQTHKIGIFTDSLSNILSLKKGIAETREQLALFIALKEFPHELKFHHVNSHRDIIRNIEVDRLCDSTKENPDREIKNYLEGKTTKEKAKGWLTNHLSLQRRIETTKNKKALYNKSRTQSWINYLTEGEPYSPNKHHHNLPRRQGILIAKARTLRWTNCEWYLTLIKKQDDARCSNCPTEETILHIIDRCNKYEQQREIMRKATNQWGNLSRLLVSNNPMEVKAIAEFLAAVDDIKVKRNGLSNLRNTNH